MTKQNRDDFEIIYDEFRTCEMNKEYYAERVAKKRSLLRKIDIFVALFGGATALASWPLWSVTIFGVPVGAVGFGVFVGVALILVAAKPYLKIEDEIERLSGIQSTYAAISFKLKEVVDEIRSRRAIEQEVISSVKVLRSVRGTLITREDQPSDRKLIDEMMKRVNERYPTSNFYYP
jgi:hypothetical protein